MNSIFHNRSVASALVVLSIVVPASGALAQEEAPAEDTGNRLGNFYLDLGTWVAQPTGLGLVPATQQDVVDTGTGTFTSTDELEIPHGTEDKVYYGLEYRLPSDFGSFVISLYKHEEESGLSRSSPSEFVYGEVLTHDIFPGYRNDGLADAFLANSSTDLRELRLDFRRKAFRSPRVAADWFVGWRRVEHERRLAADYLALVPDLPPILPPQCGQSCPNLDPKLDSAATFSSFEGRGITAGIDLDFPLWKNDLIFEGGAAVSVLRGDLDSRIEANNSYYILTDNGGNFERILCLTPGTCDDDYALFDDSFIAGQTEIFVADNIEQRAAVMVATIDRGSRTSQVLENYLGFRWRTPFKRLEVFGGFRQTRYDDVAVELTPVVSSSAPDENGQINVNVTGLTEKDGSVTYEGFYGGVTFRLY